MKHLLLLLSAVSAFALHAEMLNAGKNRNYLHRELNDKGLSAADIMAKAKNKCLPATRPAPSAQLKDQFARKKDGSIAFQRIPAEVVEESGVSRVCQVQTLLPLKKGGLFSCFLG